MTKRICVVANKWWELDPILAVLLSDYVRPSGLPWPVLLRHPRPRSDQNIVPIEANTYPRAIFRFGATVVELWCISDLLEHLPDAPDFQSSTERKAERLQSIVTAGAPAITIAIGTAARGEKSSDNGNVVIGTASFIHNGHPNNGNPSSNWTGGPFDTVITSAIDEALFRRVTAIEPPDSTRVRSHFMVPPLCPPAVPSIIADMHAVALSNVNVTNPADFTATDPETVAAFNALGTSATLGSLETTHGLIRALCGDRFLYISGIANRIGQFGPEVVPRLYAQNTVAAHNAGVVLAWMLPLIVASV